MSTEFYHIYSFGKARVFFSNGKIVVGPVGPVVTGWCTWQVEDGRC